MREALPLPAILKKNYDDPAGTCFKALKEK